MVVVKKWFVCNLRVYYMMPFCLLFMLIQIFLHFQTFVTKSFCLFLDYMEPCRLLPGVVCGKFVIWFCSLGATCITHLACSY